MRFGVCDSIRSEKEILLKSMKKLFFVLASLILLSSSAMAAGEKDVKVRFGLEAGFNMTKWNGNLMPDYGVSPDLIKATADLKDASVRPGFHAGAMADIVIQTHWSIQPELLFQLEGSQVESPFYEFDEDGSIMAEGTITENFTAAYIRIPILVYYNITNVGPGQLSPGLGIFLAGGVGGHGSVTERKTFGVDGILDEFDWGLNVKVAYELQKVASGLYMSAGFSQGFTTSKSTGLSVSVGYKFQYWKGIKKAYNTGILEYNP